LANAAAAAAAVWLRRSVTASDDTWRIEMKCAFPGPAATRWCSCSFYEHVYSPEGRDSQADRQTNKQTMTTQSYNTKEMTLKMNKILLSSYIIDSIRSGAKKTDLSILSYLK